MVNSQAEVIGIVTFKLSGTENLNFEIPVNYLRGLRESPKLRLGVAAIYVDDVLGLSVFAEALSVFLSDLRGHVHNSVQG